ncbi:uncharacterized protein AMSG_11710 [Thecamonas trahens ATCC 50062]|uniref:Uncharacterized protein n=1 Tax=Thecamonas trahens ATCC 50062 TaxID=461836 RepID=A0A0L0DW60_THETB|nr:hypothetical protein AMSG_11710 [Thecamonas trahens ATCC 50062]KNC56455.1 hypothetical protein AMSG_11710 [Thecamonas trahens ATCC 50062]|eukprot:XP_013761003.1 hypothetical protein AMSG_11710 [Thecamonas trahens ATCC 50062]
MSYFGSPMMYSPQGYGYPRGMMMTSPSSTISTVPTSPATPSSPREQTSGNSDAAALTRAAATEYDSPSAPPPTMDQLNLTPVLTSGTVSREENEYAAQVAHAKASIHAALESLGEIPVPSKAFDDVLLSDQLDSALPSAPSILPDNAEAIDAIRSAPDAGTPRTTFAGVRARIATLTTDSALSPSKLPLVNKLGAYVDEAAAAIDGSRDVAGETAFCAAVSQLLDKIEGVPSAHLAPEVLEEAHAVDAQCGVFEEKRAVEDWTLACEQEETDLYTKVEAVLAKTGEAQAVNAETYETLTAFKVIPAELDVDSVRALIAKVEAQLVAMRDAVRAGHRAGAMLSEGVSRYLDSCRKSQVAAAATVDRISAHIASLINDLGDAHMSLWKETKRVNVVEGTMDLIAKKIRVNDVLAEGEEEEAARILTDARAHLAVTGLTNETNGDVSADLADLAQARLATVVEELFNMMAARLALTARKHAKLAFAAFAVESSIEILKQEREGVLVKKQRSNAAQRADWVAQCSREVAEIEDRIASEERRLVEALRDRMAAREAWVFLFDALASLDLPPHYVDQLDTIKAAWDSELEQLKDVETRHLARVELEDQLDATFLSASFNTSH